jgi:hypothetical protein
MEIFYRVLGFFAGINQWMARNSIYFIPLNVIVLLGSLGLATGGLIATTAALGKLDSAPVEVKPASATLGELLGSVHAEGAYVTVKAELEPGLLLQYGTVKQGSEELQSVDVAWAPLIDRRTGRALYVELQGIEAPLAQRGAYTVTGVLKKLDSRVTEELQKSAGRAGPFVVDQQFMVDEGDAPDTRADVEAQMKFGGGLLGVSGVTALLFLITMSTNSIIFRKRAGPGGANVSLAVATGAKPGPVFASGNFNLDGKHFRIFNFVPAATGRMESGEIGALCNVNASSSFLGITTAKREGIWQFAAAPGDVKSVELGDLYYGFKRQASVRLLTRDARRLILSFAGPEDRAGFLNELRAIPELSALLRAG